MTATAKSFSGNMKALGRLASQISTVLQGKDKPTYTPNRDDDQMAKDPTEVIHKAVLRMLPRNKLRDDRDRKLRIFVDAEHPFGGRPLEPYIMPP
ncbi:hypothetical protein Ancab_027319 [Ancistrocladus abbreviatus]